MGIKVIVISNLWVSADYMVDMLNRLAAEVSRVAQVAGVEGSLSERAKVEGVAGSWKSVVDTLNSFIDRFGIWSGVWLGSVFTGTNRIIFCYRVSYIY